MADFCCLFPCCKSTKNLIYARVIQCFIFKQALLFLGGKQRVLVFRFFVTYHFGSTSCGDSSGAENLFNENGSWVYQTGYSDYNAM
jgi:hypothetical protein